MTGSPTGTSLSDVERRTVARFVELLESELGEELPSVWLFGSRARGEPGNADSDVDLMVATQNGKRDFSLVQKLAFRAAEEEGYPWLCLATSAIPTTSPTSVSIDDFFMQEVDRDRSSSRASHEPTVRRLPARSPGSARRRSLCPRRRPASDGGEHRLLRDVVRDPGGPQRGG